MVYLFGSWTRGGVSFAVIKALIQAGSIDFSICGAKEKGVAGRPLGEKRVGTTPARDTPKEDTTGENHV
jgi:hypothetical protein